MRRPQGPVPTSEMAKRNQMDADLRAMPYGTMDCPSAQCENGRVNEKMDSGKTRSYQCPTCRGSGKYPPPQNPLRPPTRRY